MQQIKHLIIPFIALGLVLSLAIGIEYNCSGEELFPTYYGSPFVFKRASLGSSMVYFYSISGLILNVLVWSLALFLFDKFIQRIIGKLNASKLIRTSYNMLIGLMIAFTILNIAMSSNTIGRGFEQESNYWYWNMDKEAKDLGATCEGEMILFTN